MLYASIADRQYNYRSSSETSKSLLIHLTTKVNCSLLDLSVVLSTIVARNGELRIFSKCFSGHDEALFQASWFLEQSIYRHLFLATGAFEVRLLPSSEAVWIRLADYHCHHLTKPILAWQETKHWMKSVAACVLTALSVLYAVRSAPQYPLWFLQHHNNFDSFTVRLRLCFLEAVVASFQLGELVMTWTHQIAVKCLKKTIVFSVREYTLCPFSPHFKTDSWLLLIYY